MPVMRAASLAAYAAADFVGMVHGVSREATHAAYSNSPGGRQAETASHTEKFWQATHIREVCPTCPIQEEVKE